MINDLVITFAVPFYIIRSIGSILSSVKLSLLCLIPYLIGTITFISLSYWTISSQITDWILTLIPTYDWLIKTLSWIAAPISILVSAILSILITLLLSGVFLELFSEEVLNREGFTIPHTTGVKGFVKHMIRSLKDEVIRLLYLGIIGFLLLLLGVIPIVQIIPIVLGVFLLGFNLFETPIKITNPSFRSRWRWALAHPLPIFSLGVSYTLFLLIPLLGILMLPPTYHAAIRIYKALGVSDKEGPVKTI